MAELRLAGLGGWRRNGSVVAAVVVHENDVPQGEHSESNRIVRVLVCYNIIMVSVLLLFGKIIVVLAVMRYQVLVS